MLAKLFLLLLTLAASANPAPDRFNLCAQEYGKLFAVSERNYGPRVYLRAPAEGTRDFNSIRELKVGQFNVENLYNYQGRWKVDENGKKVFVEAPSAKPERRWNQLKEVIERSDDDIMIWEEVEDFTAAQDFVNEKLGGRYRVVLIEGNDERGIDVAFLLKKDLPFDVEMQSHRNVATGNGSKQFSRDLPVVAIRKAGAKENDEPLAFFMGTHYKSQRDSDGDPRSVLRRTAQVQATVKIKERYEAAHPRTPIFLLGDFNADLRSAPEFKPLWQNGFRDSFDLSPNPLPKEQRLTHAYFPRGGDPNYSQLDGILVNKAGQDAGIVKSAAILPYRTAEGKEMGIPRSFAEREKQGSDHRKLQIKLDFEKMREAWQNR